MRLTLFCRSKLEPLRCNLIKGQSVLNTRRSGRSPVKSPPSFRIETAKERVRAMADILIEAEEEILNDEISDEALETAGTEGVHAGYTLGACTGLSVCPG
jgi:hypothetical protein